MFTCAYNEQYFKSLCGENLSLDFASAHEALQLIWAGRLRNSNCHVFETCDSQYTYVHITISTAFRRPVSLSDLFICYILRTLHIYACLYVCI